MPGHERFVLCAPRRCGFNDVLNQIWVAHLLAVREDRRLIIDTRVAGLGDDLDHYLTPQPSMGITASLTDEALARLNVMTCYPRIWHRRIDFIHRETQVRNAGASRPRRASRAVAYALDGVRLAEEPPFTGGLSRRLAFAVTAPPRLLRSAPARNRPEDLVVMHSSGGGPHGADALGLFTYTPAVRSAVAAAQGMLGPDYDALHIRHTDLRTNYKPLLHEAVRTLAGRRVLVCSDDPAVVEEARATLTDSDVVTVTTVEDTAGTGLHKSTAHRSLAERRTINTAMLVDLMALAGSSRLFVAPTRDGGFSGFSFLAKSLHRRRPLVAALMGQSP